MIKTSTIFKFLMVSAICFVSLSVFTSSSNPPAANAGEPTGTNCTSCHSGSPVTSGTSWSAIALTGLPANGYVPGTTYILTLNGSTAATSKNGFQLTALTSSNAMAGTLIAGTGTAISTQSGRSYVSHSGSNGASWSFNWTAPASGTGVVTFYTSYNATNSNSATSGDIVYTKTFTLSQTTANLPTAVITPSSTTVCLGDTLYLAGSGANNPTAFNWVFLNNNPNSATTQTVKLVYTTVGSKTIRLTTSNADGNSPQTSLNVQVVAKPTATITASNTTICGSDSIHLQANTGTGFTYLWTPGNFTTSSIYVKDTVSYRVKVTNTNGCFATSAAFKATKANYPQANLISNKDTICNSDTVMFDITGSGFTAQYFVNDTSVQNSTDLLYKLNRNNAGIYKVAAKITASGCATNLPAKYITIEKQADAPVVNCGNSTTNSIEFTWQPVANYTNYEISLDTGNTWVNANGSNQLSHTINGLLPNTTKTIWVRVKSNGPCGNGLVATKTCINNGCNPINAIYNYKRFVCVNAASGNSLTSFEVKNISNPKFLIQFETDSVISAFSRNTIFNFTAKAGNNNVRIKLKDSTETGCPIVDTTFIVKGNLAPVKPVLSTNKANNTICKGEDILVTVTKGSNSNLFSFYQTNPTKQLIEATLNNTINLGSKLLGTNNLIKAIVIDTATFCADSSDEITITENPKPVANFSVEYFKSDSNNVNKNRVVFTNLSSDSITSFWLFGNDNNATSTNKNTEFTYTKGGTYQAKLIVTNNFNCKDSITKQITITNTSLNDLTKKITVKVYPNPFTSQVNIDLENDNNGQLFIIDVNGKTIETLSLTKNQTLDLSHFAKGIYVLKMEVNQQTAYYKLVKE